MMLRPVRDREFIDQGSTLLPKALRFMSEGLEAPISYVQSTGSLGFRVCLGFGGLLFLGFGVL